MILSHALRAATVKREPLSVTYLTSGSDLANLTIYTLTGIDFGTADSTRQIFVVLNWSSSSTRTLSSATIGGISATRTNQSSATTSGVGCFFATVPTGTSGTISITMSGFCTSVTYGVYSVINRIATSAQTDSALGASISYSSPLSTSANTINANGFALGCYGANQDKTYSSSPYSLDNYNTAGAAENGWQVIVSYVNTGATQTPTQSLSWTPTGGVGIRWGLWAFDG